jgi:hypothetical protein
MRVAVIGIVIALHALSASAQTARDVKGPTPLVAIPNEAPAKLIVDPPIPEQLALGRVFIQYRTENLRILPVFGNAALAVSPRVGHLHYKVDDQFWPIVDTSGETVVLVGTGTWSAQSATRIGGCDAQADPRRLQTGGVHRARSEGAAQLGGNLPQAPACDRCNNEKPKLEYYRFNTSNSVET